MCLTHSSVRRSRRRRRHPHIYFSSQQHFLFSFSVLLCVLIHAGRMYARIQCLPFLANAKERRKCRNDEREKTTTNNQIVLASHLVKQRKICRRVIITCSLFFSFLALLVLKDEKPSKSKVNERKR